MVRQQKGRKELTMSNRASHKDLNAKAADAPKREAKLLACEAEPKCPDPFHWRADEVTFSCFCYYVVFCIILATQGGKYFCQEVGKTYKEGTCGEEAQTKAGDGERSPGITNLLMHCMICAVGDLEAKSAQVTSEKLALRGHAEHNTSESSGAKAEIVPNVAFISAVCGSTTSCFV